MTLHTQPSSNRMEIGKHIDSFCTHLDFYSQCHESRNTELRENEEEKSEVDYVSPRIERTFNLIYNSPRDTDAETQPKV